MTVTVSLRLVDSTSKGLDMRARKTTKYAFRYQWAIRTLERRDKRAHKHEEKAEHLRATAYKYETQARTEMTKLYKKVQAEKG